MQAAFCISGSKPPNKNFTFIFFPFNNNHNLIWTSTLKCSVQSITLPLTCFLEGMDKNIENCNLGQSASSRADSLRTHLETHSGEKSNKCNQCDYASTDASNLSRHLKSHNGEKLHKCNQCDYASSYAHNLRTHLKTHSGENSNKCNQCDYASNNASALRQHLKMHSGEKLNKCNQCDYASSWASALKVHLKTHSEEKSNKWNQCNVTFVQTILRNIWNYTVGKSQTNAISVTINSLQLNFMKTHIQMFKIDIN